MATRKKAAKAKNDEAFNEWRLKEDIKKALAIGKRAGIPTRSFQRGEAVRYGGWHPSVVQERCEDGFYYKVESFKEGKNGEPPQTQISFVPWVKLLPMNVGSTNFTSNEDIRLNYQNSTVESLLSKHLLFGVDFEPDYQRGLVWDQKDKESLLDSLFMGADIGRFVFRVKNDEEISDPDGDFYEIVDGKQRMTTLLDFYAGRFPYKGAFYHELSAKDRRRFRDASVSVAEARNLSKKDTLRLFLMLNRSGKPMDDDTVRRVREQYENMK